MVSHKYDASGVPYASTIEAKFNRGNYQTRRLAEAPREFRGVDGEGGNVPEAGTLFGTRHQYLSLRVGPNLLQTGNPLGWEECVSFLCSLSRKFIYVAYFFDYDVTMIIRTLPEERARKLLYPHLRINPKSGQAMPVDVGNYQLDYLPHKEFRVRHKDQKHWLIISDTGQFFQSSFLKTLEKWDIGTPEEREMIRKGKSMRADFAEHTAEIEAYNALECVLLEQLMTNFRAVCWETGYVPRKWQGPGYLASAMLEKHGVPRRDEIAILSNPSFRALAQAAYYGGRFETTAAGPVHRRIHQYDINGAYVHLLRSLPCLIHGSWRKISSRPATGTWFAEVHFNHDDARYLFNLPVRVKNGNIFYPREATGVYWSAELEAAERAGTTIDFQTGWLYENHCECRWFDFVDPYYAQRVRMGKSSKGYVLKLAGNSIYGKLAQSIGYAPWANPVWAGLITAGCRAMLIDAYREHADAIVMLATDGLFSLEPLELPISTALGDWEYTEHPNGIFIVQPGIYFTDDEAKTRGVERGRITGMQEDFNAQWEKFIGSNGIDHTVSIQVDNFITAKQALQRNKWQIAGTWEKTTRELSFDWSNKRKRGIAFARDGMVRTIPHNGSSDLVSVAYDRIIGGGARSEGERYTDPGLAERERMEQQPDWVQPLLY